VKKAIRKIHLWLGLASGLVVFIVSVTGCIYVFEEELKAWAYKDRERITVPTPAIKKPLSELLAIAQKEVGENHPIQNIEIPAAADQTYSFRPVPIRDNKAYTHFGEIVYQRKLYINPYTGDVVKNENTKFEFFTLVLRLHRNLLLNRGVGSTIVGSSVIIFVILLITGIVLWWPKNKAAIRQRFYLAWKNTTKPKRKNYDLHNVFGFYGSFILLIIALTGLTWSFDWFENSVQWIANGGVKAKKPKMEYSDTTHLGAAMPIDKILFDVINQNSEAHSFIISLPEKTKGAVNAAARSGIHVRYTTRRYQYDQFTGALLMTTNFNDKNTGEKLKALNYDIHVGAILGLPGKFLAFFASLISASLPVTGFFIWYNRKFKKDRKKKIEKVAHYRDIKTPVKRPDFSRQPVLQSTLTKLKGDSK
jgi:uncharacterized iron-regulated membrane protein